MTSWQWNANLAHRARLDRTYCIYPSRVPALLTFHPPFPEPDSNPEHSCAVLCSLARAQEAPRTEGTEDRDYVTQLRLCCGNGSCSPGLLLCCCPAPAGVPRAPWRTNLGLGPLPRGTHPWIMDTVLYCTVSDPPKLFEERGSDRSGSGSGSDIIWRSMAGCAVCTLLSSRCAAALAGLAGGAVAEGTRSSQSLLVGTSIWICGWPSYPAPPRPAPPDAWMVISVPYRIHAVHIVHVTLYIQYKL